MGPPRQRARSTVKGLTYDTGALIAYEKRDSTMMAIHESAMERNIKPVVPTGVLAQAWKGGSGTQAPLARMLKQHRVEPWMRAWLSKWVRPARGRPPRTWWTFQWW